MSPSLKRRLEILPAIRTSRPSHVDREVLTLARCYVMSVSSCRREFAPYSSRHLISASLHWPGCLVRLVYHLVQFLALGLVLHKCRRRLPLPYPCRTRLRLHHCAIPSSRLEKLMPLLTPRHGSPSHCVPTLLSPWLHCRLLHGDCRRSALDYIMPCQRRSIVSGANWIWLVHYAL
jgi:hypothetical protein